MTPSTEERSFEELFRGHPAILAPMEDVSNRVYRKLCRDLGADLCVTEFVNVEGLLRGCKTAKKKITIETRDAPTAIQIGIHLIIVPRPIWRVAASRSLVPSCQECDDDPILSSSCCPDATRHPPAQASAP